MGNDKESRKETYKVGYKKPPKGTRFRSGQSGNPKGRPKGQKNLKTLVNEEINAIIEIKDGGKLKKVPKKQALLKVLMQKALQGDDRSIYRMLQLCEAYELPEEPHPDPSSLQDLERDLQKLTKRERNILRRLVQRNSARSAPPR